MSQQSTAKQDPATKLTRKRLSVLELGYCQLKSFAPSCAPPMALFGVEKDGFAPAEAYPTGRP
jgi:hypothetical protein